MYIYLSDQLIENYCGDIMRVFNLLKTRIEEMEENGDVEGLIHALNDDAENVRREAMIALERIGDSRATEPLIQQLQHPDITIQEEAITALGRIRDKKAVSPLIQTLNNQHIGIRWKAAEALGKIGDPKATEPLIQTLQDPDKTIQEEAITALGRIRDKKAVSPLIQTLNNQHIGIRSRSAEALGKIGDPKATEPLIQTLQDPDKTVQEEAITALGRIALDPLIQDLRGDDQNLRDGAIIALNQLREFKILQQVEINDFKARLPDVAPTKETLKENISETDESNHPSSFKELKSKRNKLIESGYHIYIENFVKNSHYKYIEGFNRKSRYDYEFNDILKLRKLLQYRKMEFADEEVLWLIQEEIKNQKYLEFKEEILSQHPENLKEHIEVLIKTYSDPQNQIEKLKNLLKEQNIEHQPNLAQEIKKTQKQIEITEFENKILSKESTMGDALPVEMEDLDNAYVSFNIGNLYYDLGKLEQALSYYDKSLCIYPDFIDVWKNMGLIYFIMGRLQKAAACFTKILNLDPEYPELWVDIGIIFFEMRRVNEAKACYKKATEMNPCYHSEDLAVNTYKFLENRPTSLEKLKYYLELASSSMWESSDPTPPILKIMRLLNKLFND